MAFSSEIEKLERRWQENPLGLTFASLAEAYRKAGDIGRALELIEQGLTQHPNYVPAHIVRGRCHLDAQSDSEAELAFQRVTELDPENVIALTSLAELSERAGRLPEAVSRFQMLLDVDRNNETARGQLDRVKELMAAAAPDTVVRVAPPEIIPVRPEVVSVAKEPEAPVAAVSARAFEPTVKAPPEPEPVAPPVEVFDESTLSDLELETATQLTSAPSDDYQIPNDAESLQASDDRLSDIVLGTEPPEDFSIPESPYSSGEVSHPNLPDPAGMDSVDVLLSEDYSALMSYRDPTDMPNVEPPPAEETIFGQISMMAEAPAPAPDTFAALPAEPYEPESFLPPPPVDIPETSAADPVMESVAIPEPATAPDTDIAAETPPASQWSELEPSWRESEPVSVSDQQASPEWAAESIHESTPESEPETVAEPVTDSAAEPVTEPVAAAPETGSGMVDDYVPLGDLGAPSRYQPAAPQPEEQESASAAEPELVVTETMAEIFLRQGHRELALAVYAQLAQRDPHNERIAAALAELTPPALTTPEPAGQPAKRFAASDTGGRSVRELFGPLLAASRPTVSPTIHPPAFEQPKRASGEPTRPAQESLSLSSVFGEEAPPSGAPAGTADSGSGEPSFDEFFAPATGAAADVELPRSPESDPDGMAAQVPEDLEQFNAWLRGLKR